ncbi:hypothetical protein [Noviherbaspirillum agri]
MYRVLTDPQAVGERVHRYLHTPKPSTPDVQRLLNKIAKFLPETVVFGGMIRDFGLNKATEFSSDIDLVAMAERNEILSLIRPFNPVMNKFGGFRFSVGRQLFDIWAYHDTWAFKEHLVAADSFQQLCNTTFFNVDAACQRIGTRAVICKGAYFQSLDQRLLDINLEFNPAPRKIAARAIRLTIEHEMKMSSRLQTFVLKNAEPSLWTSRGPARSFLLMLTSHVDKHEDDGVPFRFNPQFCLF